VLIYLPAQLPFYQLTHPYIKYNSVHEIYYFKTARTIAYIFFTIQNLAMTVKVALPYIKMRELCDKSSDSNCCGGISSQITGGQADRHTDTYISHSYTLSFNLHHSVVMFIVESRLTDMYEG